MHRAHPSLQKKSKCQEFAILQDKLQNKTLVIKLSHRTINYYRIHSECQDQLQRLSIVKGNDHLIMYTEVDQNGMLTY